MPNVIRVCALSDVPGFMELEKDRYRGSSAYFTNDLLDSMADRHNATFRFVTSADGIRELVNEASGLYSGCIGLYYEATSRSLLVRVSSTAGWMYFWKKGESE